MRDSRTGILRRGMDGSGHQSSLNEAVSKLYLRHIAIADSHDLSVNYFSQAYSSGRSTSSRSCTQVFE